MCPECIPVITMTIAGTGSIGSLSLLFLRNLARTLRRKTHLNSEEKIHHEPQHPGTSGPAKE